MQAFKKEREHPWLSSFVGRTDSQTGYAVT